MSESTCSHADEYRDKISGTLIRDLLSKNIVPPYEYMRKEVSNAIIALGDEKFIQRIKMKRVIATVGPSQ